MSELVIVTLVMVLLAVTLLTITVVLVVRTRRFLASAVRVPGTIVDVDSHLSRNRESGRRTRMYAPIFSFVAPDGSEQTLRSASSSRFRPTVGEAVTILVPPDDPRRARVDRFFSVWGTTLILGFLSLPWVIASAILIPAAIG